VASALGGARLLVALKRQQHCVRVRGSNASQLPNPIAHRIVRFRLPPTTSKKNKQAFPLFVLHPKLLPNTKFVKLNHIRVHLRDPTVSIFFFF
jgi:hypothetical protein